tara:strand:- start:113069 stop:114181 length:1113 start_codon:yes stop_codon:yes gene_type:complete
MTSDWYTIQNIKEVDSPSVVLYKERLSFNIDNMLLMVNNDPSKLMPHIKTNKMPKVIALMIDKGIKKFKSSTIAEAEIAAREGAERVLIAHQLVGPKINRFGLLTTSFPNTKFSTIVDNLVSVKKLEREAIERKSVFSVFIDINSGMNRSGIQIGDELDQLIEKIKNSSYLTFKGLHVYDGHLRNPNFKDRKTTIENEFTKVVTLYNTLKGHDSSLQLISGGTPSFTSHVTEDDRICSPGTCLLWDWGYEEKLTEQEFKYAALLVTRVISKPTNGIITVDLGHKSVAPENSIDKRIKFLNLKDYELLSQSEEHGILKVKDWEHIQIGDVFYGVPYHVCPSINLHDDVSVIVQGEKVDVWKIEARKRKISI